METLSKVVTKSGKKEIGWSFIEQENANIQGNLDNVKLLHLIDDPHISLSRPFVLRRHQIEPFADLLKTNLKGKFNPFNVLFSEYEWFANDDRTRSFLSLAVSSGSNAVNNRKKLDRLKTVDYFTFFFFASLDYPTNYNSK